MTENILQFPTQLEKLADKIRNDIERRQKLEMEWVTATVDLCLHLVEARIEIPDNIAFGEWFKSCEFDLNRNERAAAIRMGEHIEIAKQVLETTKSRSIELIHDHEFRYAVERFQSTLKTTGQNETVSPPENQPPIVTVTKPKPVSKKRKQAEASYNKLAAKGVPFTQRDVVKDAGVSGTVVRAIFTAKETEQKIISEVTDNLAIEVLETSLPETDRKRYEMLKEKLEAKYVAMNNKLIESTEFMIDERAKQKSQEWLEDIKLPAYEKEMRDLERMLNNPRNFIMTKEEYNILLMCVHPDGIKSRTEEQLTQAFRTLTKYKLKMVDDAEERRLKIIRLQSAPLPKTVEEMLARKRKR